MAAVVASHSSWLACTRAHRPSRAGRSTSRRMPNTSSSAASHVRARGERLARHVRAIAPREHAPTQHVGARGVAALRRHRAGERRLARRGVEQVTRPERADPRRAGVDGHRGDTTRRAGAEAPVSDAVAHGCQFVAGVGVRPAPRPQRQRLVEHIAEPSVDVPPSTGVELGGQRVHHHRRVVAHRRGGPGVAVHAGDVQGDLVAERREQSGRAPLSWKQYPPRVVRAMRSIDDVGSIPQRSPRWIQNVS